MGIYIYIYIYFQVSVFVYFGKIVRSEITGSYGSSIFKVFWGTSTLFYILIEPIYIPTNSAQGPLFFHNLANTCYFLSFWWQPFWQVLRDISLCFWFEFLWWLVSIFSRAISSEKMSIQILCPFLNWVVCFWCWVVWILCIFWITFSQAWHHYLFR